MKSSPEEKKKIAQMRQRQSDELLKLFIQLDSFLNNFLDSLIKTGGLSKEIVANLKQRLTARITLFKNSLKLAIPRLVRSSYNQGRIVATQKYLKATNKWPTDPKKQVVLLKEIETKTVGLQLNKNQLYALSRIEENLNKSVDKVSTSVARRHDDVLRKIQLETISDMVKAGATEEEVAEEFKERLKKAGLVNRGEGFQWVDVGGRKRRIAAYADMVSRTTLAEAYSQGKNDQYDEDDIDLVIWEATTDNVCGECLPLVNKVFSRSGNHPTYPKLPFDPPVHPNCGCETNPYIP